MIKLPGQLAIRTVSGRNGDFNVGRLSTSIGEFVVKDALLDQHTEGKYRGDFVITEIRPSYYTTGGRLVVEIRAKLDSMSLEDVASLSPDEVDRLSQSEQDPIEEERRTAVLSTTDHPPVGLKASESDDRPFGMEDSVLRPKSMPENADAALFGTIWPLASCVKLDTTVDRKRLRAQCSRLETLGYVLDFKQQTWNLH
ncbi:DUF3275 family protein [Pseudomonas sp. NPDC088368]|uniref:DUF3275 family protein n=1 Tax=Pseudomonas sp. NPDC088368 TaxID=3364453 RepID=UPI00381D897A